MHTIKFPNEKLLRRIVDKRDSHFEKVADELYEIYCKNEISEIEVCIKDILQEEKIILQSTIDKRHEEYLYTIKNILQNAAKLCSSYSEEVEQLRDELANKEHT